MSEKKQILIVDDIRDNLKVVYNFLKVEDYRIALAIDGMNALQVLEKNSIDLILLDVMMPKMNGLEVCKIIKSKEEWRDIPIIFLTAKNQPEDIVAGFKAGGVDYIIKPFNKDELMVRVKTHLELRDAKQKIINMNKTRDKLYSIIAHDIKSPFSSICQTLYAIENGYFDINSNDFREIVQDLGMRAKETMLLLENLLSWTRSHSNDISIHPMMTNIHFLLNDTVNLLMLNAQEKNIHINLQSSEIDFALCDEVSIYTVFRNLLSNAIKFTPDNGHIKIHTIKDENYLNISFEDTGIGMSNEIIEKIFIKDEHHSTQGTQKEKGTGLGLFMVKDFIKKNNGLIDVKSKPEEGTTITVSLPVIDSDF